MELSLSVDVGRFGRFGHLHMTARRRGWEGVEHWQLPQWRVGATFWGKCTAQQLEILSCLHITICSGITSHMLRLSTAKISKCPQAPSKVCSLTSCLPPPGPSLLLSRVLHELSHAIAANKRRLVSGGRNCRSDIRYTIYDCLALPNGNVPILSRTMILSPD